MKSTTKTLLFIFLMIFVTSFIGIGYASISGVILHVSGDASLELENNTAITDITFFNGVNVEKNLSSITPNSLTLINAKIVLGDSVDSSITYKISLSNRSNKYVKYTGLVVDPDFYDNPLIKYEFSDLEIGDIINPNTTKDVYITFSYASDDISNNTLNKCYINIKFIESYLIKFNSNGNIGTMSNQIAFYGEDTIINSNEFTNENTEYVFDSWNSLEDASGISYSNNGIINVSDTTIESVTLFAQFKLDESLNNNDDTPSNPDDNNDNNDSDNENNDDSSSNLEPDPDPSLDG